MVKIFICILIICRIVSLLFFNYLVLKCSVLNSLYFYEQTYTIKCIVKAIGTNFHSSTCLPKDICFMYQVIYKAAVHYISSQWHTLDFTYFLYFKILEEHECEPEPVCWWKTVISLFFFTHRIGKHNKQRTLNLKLALFHQKH